MVVFSSALQWRVILCFSQHTILSKRSQLQSSVTSLIVAVFKRNSVEYTSRISSLSATQFKVKKPDF